MPQTPLNIVYLTPGAGGMFCGSCLNDNMLAAGMTRLGHSICLVPLYTPTQTDEPNQSINKLFFGGVNVYLQQKMPLFRFVPRALDRFLDRPGLVRKLAAGAVSVEASQLGAMTLSMVRGEEGNQRKEVRRLVDWLAGQPRPDIVVLSNLLIAGCVSAIRRRLNVPIVVTLQGDDVFLDDLPDEYREQVLAELRKLVTHVDRFLTHSRYYADKMADYLKIPAEKIDVVPLGLALDGFPESPRRVDPSRPPTVGYMARICPAKGFHLLVDAFVLLKTRPEMSGLRLHAAGWLGDADRPYFQQQQARLRQAGLTDHFHYAGVLDRPAKLQFLQSVDVLSVPTTYQEPKGRYVLESLACGVPVVQPEHGAFPEMLERVGGGRLFPPGNTADLAEALGELLSHGELCRQLGEEGRRAVHAHSSAAHVARQTVAVLRDCIGMA